MRLEISPRVPGDLEAIADYIAEDSPERAERVLLSIERKIEQIAAHPLLYQVRADIRENTRLATVGRYVILYRLIGKVVRIERIVYGGRNLPSLLE